MTAWPVGRRPTLAWGGYLGDDHGGSVEIEVEPGAIVRYGQKDGRGNRGINQWAIALLDGSIHDIDEPTAARYYRSADRTPIITEIMSRRDQVRAINPAHKALMQTESEADGEQAAENWMEPV